MKQNHFKEGGQGTEKTNISSLLDRAEIKKSLVIGRKAFKDLELLAKQSEREGRRALVQTSSSKNINRTESMWQSGYLSVIKKLKKSVFLEKSHKGQVLSVAEKQAGLKRGQIETPFTSVEIERNTSPLILNNVSSLSSDNASEKSKREVLLDSTDITITFENPKEGTEQEHGQVTKMFKKTTKSEGQTIPPGAVFQGKVELLILPPANNAILSQFIDAIRNIPSTNLILVGWTNDEGTEVLVYLAEKIDLVNVLLNTGLVENVFMHKRKIAVHLKDVK